MKKLQPFIGPAVLAAMVLLIFHRSLFSGGALLPTLPNTDLHTEFLGWRFFAFNQWMHGHFPLWNPHVFAGIPFFSQIQSNLLYPISWVFFLADVATASTIEMAANIFLAAICMYCWTRQRGISRAGATLAGITFAFSGPVYLHVMAGHPSPLAGIAWIPLVFLATDRLLARDYRKGILIGAISVCLQILGGSPQFAYYSFLIVCLYLLLLSPGQQNKISLYASFAAMYLLGGMLAAIQLIPAYKAATYSIRAGGTSYAFSSLVSFPPENLTTLFIPYPFGDVANLPYMGRWYLWETSAYAGLICLVLACIGLSTFERAKKWRMLILLATVFLLMLGSYTPLHELLYRYLPGFASFRAAAKFSVFWTMLLSILAAHGFDAVAKENLLSPLPVPRERVRVRASRHTREPSEGLDQLNFLLPTVLLVALSAIICFLLAFFIHHFDSPTGPAARLLNLIATSGQSYIKHQEVFSRPTVRALLTSWMTQQWLLAGLSLLLAAILLYWRRYSPKPAYLLLILAIAQVYLSAANSNVTSAAQSSFPSAWVDAVSTATANDQRVLFADSIHYSNQGNLIGYDSLWGYDPGQPLQYTNLIAASQGQQPPSADVYNFELVRISPIFRLLRCRYIFESEASPPTEIPNPMPHLQLMGNYQKSDNAAAISQLTNGNFDFLHSAILQTDPTPAPTSTGTHGHATLLHQSINDLEIQADLPAPALLLITDAYAPGWRIRPIDPNKNQSHYDLLQTDAVLRAIPLTAGHHHFDLYFSPPGLTEGIILSAIGLLLCTAGIAWTIKRHTNHSLIPSPGSPGEG